MGQGSAEHLDRKRLLDVLKRVFGFDQFRPNQEQIVRAIVAGSDVFTVMPTGGGKSLCYQLPACLRPGAAVVVSPLISLMKDQVDAAKANGLRAEFLNSTLSPEQRDAVLADLRAGELDLLYIAPERFAIGGFSAALAAAPLSLFAIDEAHCISEWGHDFRPDYLSLSQIVQRFPAVPVAAFTATATPQVQHDIINRLGLRRPLVVRASFDRPELFYRVVAKEGLTGQLIQYVKGRPGDSGIIYRTTRNDVEATAAALRAQGVEALPYHAGMDPAMRQRHQEAFNRDEVQVIVATIAFGMGIDKSNVRYVLHGDLPKNIESYYQETGRAGRDGAAAECVLFFSRGDASKIRYFIDQVDDEQERRIASAKLHEMVQYAALNVCRRRQLLTYFGETAAADGCDACDVCRGDVERVDSTTDAQKIMSAVLRTGEAYGINHVIDVVAGARSAQVLLLGHDQLKTYGVGRDRDKRHWRRVVNDLLAQACLRVSDGRFPVLQLTDKGRDVLFGRARFYVLRQRELVGRSRGRRRVGRAAATAPAGYDAALFERLREVRLWLARRHNVPPFVIFSDRTLQEMARARPTTEAALRRVPGVGDTKLVRYGQPFLAAIAGHGD